MRLVTQWARTERRLPEGWTDVRLALTVDREDRFARASGLLAPLQPGRVGDQLRFHVARGGTGPSPAALERALNRLDLQRVRGTLEVVDVDTRPAAAEAGPPPLLAEAWDAAQAELPPDWSDVYGEIVLTSSDDLDPAALALAPLNPARFGPSTSFRFRCAKTFGYGASPGMVRRCLERLDEREIAGRLTILFVLSDTRPVGTQGPVWYVGGKVV
jgi:hypothetical protein